MTSSEIRLKAIKDKQEKEQLISQEDTDWPISFAEKVIKIEKIPSPVSQLAALERLVDE